jgi:predicted 3-demethylubiquinone-9 3-methyltransferase (glyoxalase superfamily)
MTTVARVTTCLHFPGNAVEAVELYLSVFPGSRLLDVQRYGEGAPRPAGDPMLLTFELAGTRLHAINGIADWPFTEAMSLMVACRDQIELDRCWSGLLEAGGEPMACGWLKDRFGVRWQIVPEALEQWFASDDQVAKGRLMHALWGMVRLDIAALEAAFRGAD